MVTTWKLAQSGSPESTDRKKSLMHSHGSSFWRGKVNRVGSLVSALVLEDDQVVAVGVGGEVAPGHLGHQQLLGLGPGQLLAQQARAPAP